MKFLSYLILVLLLVPVQMTLLPHLSVGNIKPDLGLVAAAFVGLFAGEMDGLLVGFAIGWVLSLFSAGELWLSLLTHGGVGFLAGFVVRQVSHVTSIFVGVLLLAVSLASGLLAAVTLTTLDRAQVWQMVGAIVLPQACFDGLVGAGLYWLLSQRVQMARLRTE